MICFHLSFEKERIPANDPKELRWVDKDLRKFPTNSLSVTRLFNKWIRITEL